MVMREGGWGGGVEAREKTLAGSSPSPITLDSTLLSHCNVFGGEPGSTFTNKSASAAEPVTIAPVLLFLSTAMTVPEIVTAPQLGSCVCCTKAYGRGFTKGTPRLSLRFATQGWSKQ